MDEKCLESFSPPSGSQSAGRALMAMVTVGLETFEKTIGKGIVLLDAWASWCPPCQAFGPVFEAASEQNPDVVFGKLNTEEEPELAARLRIRAIPTVLAYKEGNLVFARPGFLSRPALDSLIEVLRALDAKKCSREAKARTAARS
jgi:thioredoxin